MNVILSILTFMLFCIDYYYIYYYTKDKNKNLTERQRAYILSIKASFTLFILGLFYNIKYFQNNLDLNNETFVINLAVLNLMAYFFIDCVIGFFEYHKYLCSLSGYVHHIIYFCISFLSLKLSMTAPYVLFFIEELPTFFLSIGYYNKNLRFDNLFGFTFFLTRIVYHLFLIVCTYKIHLLFIILGVCSLGLHSYWFKNWLTKYYFKRKSN